MSLCRLACVPRPQPLTGATSFDSGIATAETYVPGGDVLPSGDHAVLAFAEAFAQLIRLAPRPAECPPSRPARSGSTTPDDAPATDYEPTSPMP